MSEKALIVHNFRVTNYIKLKILLKPNMTRPFVVLSHFWGPHKVANLKLL